MENEQKFVRVFGIDIMVDGIIVVVIVVVVVDIDISPYFFPTALDGDPIRPRIRDGQTEEEGRRAHQQSPSNAREEYGLSRLFRGWRLARKSRETGSNLRVGNRLCCA